MRKAFADMTIDDVTVGAEPVEQKRRDAQHIADGVDAHNENLKKDPTGLGDLIEDSVSDPSIKRMLGEAASGSAVRGNVTQAIKDYKKSIGEPV